MAGLTIGEEGTATDPSLRQPQVRDSSCWKQLFRNPTVAEGFPVPRRPADMPGLEISLEAMCILVNATRLTVFNNRAVLKGFNAAIVLADSRGSILQWHFICNDDGSRLPYSDPRILSSLEVEGVGDLPRIRAARHILGWSANVSYNIGKARCSHT